jgi:hypothetical protein
MKPNLLLVNPDKYIYMDSYILTYCIESIEWIIIGLGLNIV